MTEIVCKNHKLKKISSYMDFIIIENTFQDNETEEYNDLIFQCEYCFKLFILDRAIDGKVLGLKELQYSNTN